MIGGMAPWIRHWSVAMRPLAKLLWTFIVIFAVLDLSCSDITQICLFTHAGCIAAGVGISFSLICLFVNLFVRALKGKWLELNIKLGTHMLCSSRLACIDPKVKVTQSHGYVPKLVKFVWFCVVIYNSIHQSRRNLA